MQIPVQVRESQIFQEMAPFLIIKVEIREEFPDSKKYDLLKSTLKSYRISIFNRTYLLCFCNQFMGKKLFLQ